jgi:hypothetical protein
MWLSSWALCNRWGEGGLSSQQWVACRAALARVRYVDVRPLPACSYRNSMRDRKTGPRCPVDGARRDLSLNSSYHRCLPRVEPESHNDEPPTLAEFDWRRRQR